MSGKHAVQVIALILYTLVVVTLLVTGANLLWAVILSLLFLNVADTVLGNLFGKD